MSIIAKYPATCPTCRRPIHAGDRIEWNKGTPARHALCAASQPMAPAAYRAPTAHKGHGGGICDECGEPRRNLVECSDSSGIRGRCCPRCASAPSYERSFA